MSWRRMLAFGRAQVRPNQAQTELARLVTIDDLGGLGWRALDERAWETGRAGDDAGWAERARAAGLLTVWRSWEQLASQRWLWIQLTRLASEDDAVAALTGAPDRLLRNLRSEVAVVAERDVDAPALEGAGATWAHEQRTKGRRGPGITRYLGFTKGDTLAVVAASGLGDVWPWRDVQQVAQLQADRL